MREYKDMTKAEQELDDYLCSDEHHKYFLKKLRRGLKMPIDYEVHKEEDNEI